MDFTFDDCFISFPVKKGDWFLYFTEHLGRRRFEDICRRMKINMRKQILERDLAKIVVGSSDVKRQDIQEVLNGERNLSIPEKLRKQIKGVGEVEDLQPEAFDALYQALASPFPDKFCISLEEKTVEEEIHEAWHFAYSSIKFDPYWFTKKRLHLLLESFRLDQNLYYERLASFYVACEDLEVGCYLPAPKGEKPNYYRVAGQLITGQGQIGMFLVPATRSMRLLPIRVTRGTPITVSSLDFTSHLITDMESDIGKMGYQSGKPYQQFIHGRFEEPYIELGYSIGGTIAQWRAADQSDKLESLWLFKSPGVPKEVWERFNRSIQKREKPLDIHIFSAKRDFVDLVGEYTLGYKAPKNVNLHLYIMDVPRPNPHRYGFVDPQKVQLTKVPNAQIEAVLATPSRRFFETARKKLGKHLFLPLLKGVRFLFGWHLEKRTKDQLGLWYESWDNQKWSVVRLLPEGQFKTNS